MKYLGTSRLETERLILRPTEEKDLKELWNILLIPEVNKYYLVTKISNSWEDEEKWQYKKLNEALDKDIFRWTIELKETNDVIGQIDVFKTDEEGIYDIGWFIDKDYFRFGYTFEASLEILKYMFIKCDIKAIDTCCCKKNPSSYNLMEKLGFKRLDKNKMIKYTFCDEEEECYCYYLTKLDFLKENFRRESLFISEDIDKDPYIKDLTEDLVTNVTGESGSGKSTFCSDLKDIEYYYYIDTDNLKDNKERNKYEDKVYNYIKDNYDDFDIIKDFDLLYKIILDMYLNKGRILVIDSAQFRNMKDLSLLKGNIVILRTCINTCYKRCIERFDKKFPDATFEERNEYIVRKKNIFKWYKSLNKFIDKVDKL